VLFSGDKLVGGPQAGLIVGRAALIGRLRRDPLARAMRPDKAILAGVAATLAIYRAGAAALEIPVWKTIALTADELQARAEWIVGLLDGTADVQVVALESPVGGGSLPGQTLPSFGVRVDMRSASAAARELRTTPDRILARIVDDALVFDLRTVTPFEDGAIVQRVQELRAAGR
jgi:L-seryl-tRNA(Ser) seleniumtransferase